MTNEPIDINRARIEKENNDPELIAAAEALIAQRLNEVHGPYGTAYEEVKEKVNTSDSLLQRATSRAYGTSPEITYAQMMVELVIVRSCIEHAIIELQKMIDYSGGDYRLQF